MKKESGAKKVGNFILSIALLIIIIGIWIGADWAGILKPYTLPSIPTILDTAVSYIQKGKLQENIIVSFVRVYKGFLIAMVIALAMGTAVALFPKFDKFTNLVLQIIRPIPPIAWIPLAILWFGIGEGPKLFIIFLGSFFAMFTNTSSTVSPYSSTSSTGEEPPFCTQPSDLSSNVVMPPSLLPGEGFSQQTWLCAA